MTRRRTTSLSTTQASLRCASTTHAATRIVLAVDPRLSGGDELGAVTVAELSWTEVRSLFADDPEAAELRCRARRAAVRGLDLSAALAAPAVERSARRL